MNDVYLVGFAAGDSDDEEMERDSPYQFPQREAMCEEIEDRKFNFNGYEGFSTGQEGGG